jgi:hypothetical protein
VIISAMMISQLSLDQLAFLKLSLLEAMHRSRSFHDLLNA